MFVKIMTNTLKIVVGNCTIVSLGLITDLPLPEDHVQLLFTPGLGDLNAFRNMITKNARCTR